jgi:hypothetical protein
MDTAHFPMVVVCGDRTRVARLYCARLDDREADRCRSDAPGRPKDVARLVGHAGIRECTSDDRGQASPRPPPCFNNSCSQRLSRWTDS